jgi:hypothetical protein
MNWEVTFKHKNNDGSHKITFTVEAWNFMQAVSEGRIQMRTSIYDRYYLGSVRDYEVIKVERLFK